MLYASIYISSAFLDNKIISSISRKNIINFKCNADIILIMNKNKLLILDSVTDNTMEEDSLSVDV